MIWAIKNNEKVMAQPKQKAICPLCNNEVISKCGDIKIWHWAHISSIECDSFKEPETKWHIDWKNNFPQEMQEIIIGEHRADIKTKDGLIIEFQNSQISPKKIIERENFYKNMVWILNGKTLGKNIIYFKKKFEWKWLPKSWLFSNKTKYVDKDKFLYKIDLDKKEFIKLSKEAFIIYNGGNPFKNAKN